MDILITLIASVLVSLMTGVFILKYSGAQIPLYKRGHGNRSVTKGTIKRKSIMKKNVTVLFLLFISVNTFSQIPTWSWAKNLAMGLYLPGSNGEATRAEWVDGQGNIYIATSFRDKVFLDTDSLVGTSGNYYGIFVVKYNNGGTLVWKKNAPCTKMGGTIGVTGIYGDNNGKLYLSHYFVDTLTYDGNIIVETPGNALPSLLVTSINSSDGGYNWSNEVAPKYNGNSVLGVNPSGEAVVAYTNIQYPAQDTFGIVKLNNIGTKTLDRKHLLGTLSYFNVQAISTTGSNIFVMGKFTNNFTLAGQAFTTSTTDFIAARFDNAGELTWSGGGKSSSSPVSEIGNITEDADQNFYITGSFSGTLSVLNTAQTLLVSGKDAGASVELFYAKYSSSGALIWLKQGAGPKSNYAKKLRIGADNKLYMMGRMGSKKLYLGGDSTGVEGVNSSNPYFLAQLDTAGNCSWLRRVNHTGNLQGNTNLFVDNSMNLYFAGSYSNGFAVPIEPFTLPVASSNRVFYAMTSDLAIPSGVRLLPSHELPLGYNLNQNYPNPFNPSTTIKFDVPVSGFVSLNVYDVSGREVATLVNQTIAAGSYEATLNANGLASGVYFCRLTAGQNVQTMKLLLQK